MEGIGRKTKGFTLIELMIVVAIMAILVALAVPAYRDFTIRSKIAECIGGLGVPKVQISEYQQTFGAWPPNASEAGIETTLAILVSGLTQFCRIQFYNNGQGDFAVLIDSVAVDASLAGINIIPVMSPVVNSSGGVDWHCTLGGTDPSALKYLPAQCRNSNVFFTIP